MNGIMLPLLMGIAIGGATQLATFWFLRSLLPEILNPRAVLVSAIYAGLIDPLIVLKFYDWGLL